MANEKRELAADEQFRRRLTLPAYELKIAARYARVTTQTVRNWQRHAADGTAALSERESGAALSYMQLQELAIVATMRRMGVDLEAVRLARDYLGERWQTEFPFASVRLKTDGQRLLHDIALELGEDATRLVVVNKGGQFTWEHMLERRFEEFEYINDIALRWKVAGPENPIVIDPRISFGAPIVKGVATWVIRERWDAGESLAEIAYDFALEEHDVREALRFEDVDPSAQSTATTVAT